MSTNESKYPLKPISLDKLDYRWYLPRLRTSGMDIEESFNVRKHLVAIECLKNPEWRPRNKRSQRLLEIFNSIKNEGMKNPLIIGHYMKDRYIVIVGNQRLSILRALNELGQLESDQIMCRIEPDENYWDTDWPPARKEHPYAA